MIELDFNKKKTILSWNILGVITIEDVKEAIDKSDIIFKGYDEVRIIQIDNESVLKMSIVDHYTLGKYAKKLFKKYKLIKTAFIVNKPVNVAYAIIALDAITSSEFRSKVFSTVVAAENWIST